MFSNRTKWDFEANSLAASIAKRKESGLSFLDLTVSNPTLVGLGLSGKNLLDTLSNVNFDRYQPDPFGVIESRLAICRYYQNRGINIFPEQIVITASTSEAYAFLFKLLTNPGDEILVPSPSYPLFEYLATLESARAINYPLFYDGDWHLDEQALDSLITSRTRVMVLVNPNNPTGSFLKKEELKFIIQLCKKNNLAIISDEVFSDYSLRPTNNAINSILELEQNEVLAFSLNGLSKILALPQIKLSWMTLTGPNSLVEEAKKRLEIISDTYLSVNSLAQFALGHLLENCSELQNKIISRLRNNLQTIDLIHKPSYSWQPLRIEGGWSAVLRVPRIHSELELAQKLIDEAGVIIHPGYFYDFPHEAFFIVSLIVNPDVFCKGIGLINKIIEHG